MKEKRDDKGRYTSDTTPEDVRKHMTPGEPYGTREVADTLSIPRRTAYKHLSRLEEDGVIRKKKLDPRRVVWIRE